MNFQLVLLVLSAVTGAIALIDMLFFKKNRALAMQPPRLVTFSRSYFPVFFFVLILRSFLLEPFRIPSGSLEPTLKVGDFVVVNKFSYGIRLPVWDKKIIPVANPRVGDVAVFRWPSNPELDYIKRVIGVPGDKIGYHNKVLTLNGKVMPQTFVEYTTDESSGAAVAEYREVLNGVSHAIYVRPSVAAVDFDISVPEGSYFMMGDNRDDSADSRYWGFVADEYLRGKAFLVWMSWNSQTGSIRWSNIGHWIR